MLMNARAGAVPPAGSAAPRPALTPRSREPREEDEAVLADLDLVAAGEPGGLDAARG
jgi:hypothetical protein